MGVGFSGTPEIDIYANVANMYLMMANQIGLTGVMIFLLTMAGVFEYGRRAWRTARDDPEFAAIHSGFHAALFTALVNAVADLYFFRLDFQASITWFWLIVALCVASSKLVLDRARTRALGMRHCIRRPLPLPWCLLQLNDSFPLRHTSLCEAAIRGKENHERL